MIRMCTLYGSVCMNFIAFFVSGYSLENNIMYRAFHVKVNHFLLFIKKSRASLFLLKKKNIVRSNRRDKFAVNFMKIRQRAHWICVNFKPPIDCLSATMSLNKHYPEDINWSSPVKYYNYTKLLCFVLSSLSDKHK